MQSTHIEWCDKSWNPITGCLNTCPYCYARKISMRFKGHFNPEFHKMRLLEPYRLKTPSKIFTCSMSDMFGSWVKNEWIENILQAIRENPRHIFQILTKFPENATMGFPDNVWLGTTIDVQKSAEARLRAIKNIKAKLKFISFEPMLEPITIALKGIDWVIIGGQTNPTKIPEKEWVDKIVEQAKELNIPVFIKENCHYPEKMQSFPR